MTHDAIPPVQSTTDTAVFEVHTLQTTTLLASPSEKGTTSIEDERPSSIGQEGPNDTSAPSPGKISMAATKVAAVEDPIVFIDPVGARWILPFETAKTWDV